MEFHGSGAKQVKFPSFPISWPPWHLQCSSQWPWRLAASLSSLQSPSFKSFNLIHVPIHIYRILMNIVEYYIDIVYVICCVCALCWSSMNHIYIYIWVHFLCNYSKVHSKFWFYPIYRLICLLILFIYTCSKIWVSMWYYDMFLLVLLLL